MPATTLTLMKTRDFSTDPSLLASKGTLTVTCSTTRTNGEVMRSTSCVFSNPFKSWRLSLMMAMTSSSSTLLTAVSTSSQPEFWELRFAISRFCLNMNLLYFLWRRRLKFLRLRRPVKMTPSDDFRGVVLAHEEESERSNILSWSAQPLSTEKTSRDCELQEEIPSQLDTAESWHEDRPLDSVSSETFSLCENLWESKSP
ncbi:hypothetical protein E2C01_012958 [Portunus trituberculatus]|uniref:Uncharacterized protein n=1 Tax=Portunus trituberculatus TaxID=210409 RepID=A0A5B7DFD8_PORTR|nr:hypothetical protein [Portunus trituberculatus]